MAAKPLTRCPACKSKITNRFECRNCGLLFDRYFKTQARKKAAEQARAERRSRTIRIFNTVLILTVLVALGVSGYYYLGTPKSPGPTVTASPETASQPAPAETAAAAETTSPGANRTDAAPAPAAAEEQTSSEIAWQALATIQTPWARGMGFFIAPDKLLTTQATAQYDQRRLQQDLADLEREQTWLEEESAAIEALVQQETELTDELSRTRIRENIEARRQRLENRRNEYLQKRDWVDAIRTQLDNADIVITLADGTETRLAFMEVDPANRLALLTVYNTGVTPIQTAEEPLKEGDTVYTLGPNRTSIKAVFTGYSQQGLLQANAPMAASHAGGPLVDEQGRVHGISILSPQEQRATGLAVPLSAVRQAFSF